MILKNETNSEETIVKKQIMLHQIRDPFLNLSCS